MADEVVGLPHRRLRPGVRMRDAALADLHHQLVFGEDRRRAFPVGLLRRDRHPVHALRVEQVDPRLPVLGVEQLGLQVQELFDLALQVGAAVRRRSAGISAARGAAARHRSAAHAANGRARRLRAGAALRPARPRSPPPAPAGARSRGRRSGSRCSWVLGMACSSRYSAEHVGRPGAELVAHHRFRRAVVRIGDAVFLAVVAEVAVKAHPVAAVRLQAPLALGPVLQVVGVDHRGRRIDEVVVPEAAPVDGLGRALQAEVPDLRQRLVRPDRPQAAQLLQRRLHRQVRIDQHVVDAARQVLLGALLAVGLSSAALRARSVSGSCGRSPM